MQIINSLSRSGSLACFLAGEHTARLRESFHPPPAVIDESKWSQDSFDRFFGLSINSSVCSASPGCFPPPRTPHPPPRSQAPGRSLLHAALIRSCRPLQRNILSHLDLILFYFWLLVVTMNFPPDSTFSLPRSLSRPLLCSWPGFLMCLGYFCVSEGILIVGLKL